MQTVKIGTTNALTGSVTPGTTWIRGNIYNGTASTASPSLSNGLKHTTSRPAALVNSTGAYYTIAPPTYEEYDISNVLNVKDIPALPVRGDGTTDDTPNLQIIITSAAQNGQVLFFPQGAYVLTDTLHIPPGSRLIGEAWPRFVPRGDKFKDAKNPKAMIRVGNPGDVGVAQMTDFLFYTAETLPGLVMVEVNMAGDEPGNVGFFNTHFLIIGGLARLCAHLKPTSSVYWENSWATGQGNGVTGLGFGGGFLVEARMGTWMVGIGTGEYLPGGLV